MLPGQGLESKSNIQSEAAGKPQFLYDRRYWRCWLLHCSRQDKFVVILVLVPATPDINQSSKQTPKLPANSSSRKTPIPGDSPPINNQQTKYLPPPPSHPRLTPLFIHPSIPPSMNPQPPCESNIVSVAKKCVSHKLARR